MRKPHSGSWRMIGLLCWTMGMAAWFDSPLAASSPQESPSARKTRKHAHASKSAPKDVQGTVTKDCADCPEMIPLPGGEIALGKFEVTRRQFARFAADTRYATKADCTLWKDNNWARSEGWNSPGFMQTDDSPVVCVNWDDAAAYAKWLSGKTHHVYRLPTEQEWLSACRAGGNHEYCGSNDIGTVAWYAGNSQATTHPVGLKQPNAWGFHDMAGNAREWTSECAEKDCRRRIVRGGSWNDEPAYARTDYRFQLISNFRSNFYGFRLALTPGR